MIAALAVAMVVLGALAVAIDLAVDGAAMSQASKARVKSLTRERLGLAKMIVQSGAACAGEGGGPVLMGGLLELGRADAILNGSMTFDVAVAREFTEGLAAGQAQDPYSVGRRKVAGRLLAALKGQAIECQGRGGYACTGTGHNLRGVLPPIEWNPAVRRRALEHETHDLHPPRWRPLRTESWVRVMAEETLMPPGFCEGIPIGSVFLARWDSESRSVWHSPETRACPRGEHRHTSHPDGWRGLTPDQRINAKYWNSIDNPGKPLAPRWHLGRIKHDRQRRVRNAPATAKVAPT